MSSLTANTLYQSRESRLDTVGSFTHDQIETWQMIRSAFDEYRQNHHDTLTHGELVSSFVLWLKSQWGISISKIPDGFDRKFTVESEEKFLMFALKFKHRE